MINHNMLNEYSSQITVSDNLIDPFNRCNNKSYFFNVHIPTCVSASAGCEVTHYRPITHYHQTKANRCIDTNLPDNKIYWLWEGQYETY